MKGPQKPLETYPLAADLPAAPPVPGGEAAGALAAEADEKPEVAQLDFLDPAAMQGSVTLAHPFRLDGKVVSTITLRRLTVGEVGALVQQERFDLFDFYAAIAGLPAPVLRGLADLDGEAFVEKAQDFLPPTALKIWPRLAPGD